MPRRAALPRAMLALLLVLAGAAACGAVTPYEGPASYGHVGRGGGA
jgi:hypothetical protein